MKYNNDQMIIIRQVIVYEICICTFACCKYVYHVCMIDVSFTPTQVGYYLDSWPCLNGIYILFLVDSCASG